MTLARAAPEYAASGSRVRGGSLAPRRSGAPFRRRSSGPPASQPSTEDLAPYFDYVAKTEAPAGIPLVVTVTATDHAGNESTASAF